MKLGAQLYTLRQQMRNEKEIEGTLKKVADIGYKYVQVSGIGRIEPIRLREICDNFGLEIALTHTAAERILGDTDAVICDHEIMGCKYIGLGSMVNAYHSPLGILDFISNYKKAMTAIKNAGMKLMYHNHSFEFQKFDGKTLFDMLKEGTESSCLGFTLDTYWVQHAGVDVCKLIGELDGRLECAHLKDMAMRGKEPVMAPVGEGNMNFDGIIEALRSAGTEYVFVEQDTCEGEPIDCLATSFENLRRYGFR